MKSLRCANTGDLGQRKQLSWFGLSGFFTCGGLFVSSIELIGQLYFLVFRGIEC